MTSAQARLFAGIIVLMFLQQSCTGSAGPETAKRYKLYCVNNRIEIGARTLEDMKWARGDQVCLFNSYETLLEAEAAANHFCRIGAGCSCPLDGSGPTGIKCEPKPSASP